MKLHEFMTDSAICGDEFLAASWRPWRVVARLYDGDGALLNDEDRALACHYKGAFAFGAPDLVTFNIHGDGKVWWREGVAGESSQTPRPFFTTPTITFPAPRHSAVDVINATIEANEIPPEKWYPKGHMPELIKKWPLTEDIEMPNPFAAPPE